MAEPEVEDADIDAALRGALDLPSETSQVSDDEIDAALRSALEPKAPRKLGAIEKTFGPYNILEPATRFGAAAAGRGVALGVGLRNLMALGRGRPMKFENRTFVRKLEEMGVLSEASALDRIAERGGDVAAFVAAAGGMTGPLVAAGLSAGVANAVSLVGLSSLDLRQQAENAGVKLELGEYAKTAAWGLLFASAGHVVGGHITAAAQRLMKRPLGQVTQAAIKNSALGGLFEGGHAVYTKDPRWLEATAAGVLGFNVGNAWFAGFPGMSRARIPTEQAKQVGIAARAVEAEADWRKELGLRPDTPIETDARRSQATNWILNQQVPWRTSERSEKWTPEERDAVAAEAEARFGVPGAEARKLADRRPTKLEGEAIYEARKQEGMILEAESRGTPVLNETLYRMDLMEPGEKKLWEAERGRMTPEEQKALAEEVPSAEEGLKRTEALERAIEEEAKTAFKPEVLPPQRGALEPPGPPKLEAEATAKAGVMAEKRAKAETGQKAQRVGQVRAAAISEEAVTTGKAVHEEALARAQERAIGKARKAFEAEEEARVKAMGEPAQRLPLRAGVKQAPEEERARLLQGATGGFAPVRPEAVQSFERETGTRVTEPTKETNEAPRPTKAPGEAIAPEKASQAEVMAKAGQGPPTPPKGATAAERASEILGEAAEVTPRRQGAPSTKEDKSRLRTIKAIEAATARLEHENLERQKTKPKLRPEERDQLFFQVAPIALVAGSAAALAFAREEDDRARIAELAGIPIFALLMRRPLAPAERWQAAEMERHAALEKAAVPLEDLIYRGKPGPRKAAEYAVDLAKALEDVPEGPARRWDPRQMEIFLTAGGHRLARFGPMGKIGTRLAQDMNSDYLRTVQGWRTRSRTRIEGEDPKADTELGRQDQKVMNQWMESWIDPKTERPAWDSMSPSVQQRAAEQLLTFFNREAGPPEIRKGAKSALKFRDELYSHFEQEGSDWLPGFSPLHSYNGRYRQLPFREDVFYPSSWMRVLKPVEWQTRVDEARRLQKLIAEDTGVPVEIVSAALRGAQSVDDLPPFGEGVHRMITRKSTNLDQHRVFNTLVGKNWDPVANQEQYVDGAASRLEFAKRFGANGEVAEELMKAAKKDGYSPAMFAHFLDAATLRRTVLSTSLYESPLGLAYKKARPVLRELEAAIALKSLGGFAVAQLPQPALIPTHTGIRIAVNQAVKGIRTSIAQSRVLPKGFREKFGDEIAAEFVADAGIVSQAVHADYVLQMQGTVPRVLTGYLRYAGGQLDRGTRNVAALGGDKYFKVVQEEYRWAKKRGDREAERMALLKFRELFDEPVHREMAAKGEAMEPYEYERLRLIAAEKVSNRVNYRRLPIDMPLFASDPVGRSFYMLSGFAIRSTAEFYRQLTQSLRNPAVRKRVLASWLLTTGFGVGAIQLQRMRRHDKFDPENDSLWREVIEGMAYASLGTGFYDAFQDLTGAYGNPAHSIAGPFWGNILEFGDTIPRARRAGSVDPVLKHMARNLPFGPLPLVPGFPTPKEVSEKLFPSGYGMGRRPRKRRPLLKMGGS